MKDAADFKKALRFGGILLAFEIAIIFLYGFCTDYSTSINTATGKSDGGAGFYYGMFVDVHWMVYVGFGFLMIFLRSYSWSSVCFNFLLSALAFQWSMLCIGFFHTAYKGTWGEKIPFDVEHLIGGDFAAASAMITLGALLGKTSSTQLVVLVFFMMIVYAMNEMVCILSYQAIDMGGSLVIHTFGAVFGLTVSWVLGHPTRANSKISVSKWSSTTAMIGTIVLFMLWPSFNGALALGSQQHRVIINTLLAITGSVLATFIISRLFRHGHKFSFEDIANATLAGGVAVGSSADLVIRPWGALVLGNVAGILSTLGFIYATPLLDKYLKIHDTCGVFNLHFMPGVLGGIAGAISAATAGEESYGLSIGFVFPARAPSNETLAKLEHLEPGLDRSASVQGGYQAAAIFTSIAFAIAGGLLTGFIIRLPWFDPIKVESFQDATEWEMEIEDEEMPLKAAAAIEDAAREAEVGIELAPRSGAAASQAEVREWVRSEVVKVLIASNVPVTPDVAASVEAAVTKAV